LAVLKQAGKNHVKLTDDRDVKDLGMKHSAIKGFFGGRIGPGLLWDEPKACDWSKADDAL
jgi:hypothetical protein